MSNPFARKKSQNQPTGPTILQRLIQQNKQPLLQFQANIEAKPNTERQQWQKKSIGIGQVSGSRISRTQSVDIGEPGGNVGERGKGLVQKLEGREQRGIGVGGGSPGKKNRGGFDVHGGQDQKKVDRNQYLKCMIMGPGDTKIGQLSIHRIELFGRLQTINLQSLQISPEYLTQCSKSWQARKAHNPHLSQSLNTRNLSVLQTLSRSPSAAMPDSLLRRLRQGLDFYEYQQEREQAYQAYMKQMRDQGMGQELFARVEKFGGAVGGVRVDGVLGIYCGNCCREGEEGKFIMEDIVNLLRVYQELTRNGRLSSRKLIKLSQQLAILQSLPRHFRKYSKTPQSTEIGLEMIQLLSILLIKQKHQVSSKEFVEIFLPVVKELQQCSQAGEKDTRMRDAINCLMLDLFANWPAELQRVQVGGQIESFMGYYRKYKGKDVGMLVNFMNALNEFSTYNTAMQDIVSQKCESFIAQSVNINREDALHTAMEAILLIKECRKANIVKFEDKLIGIVFQCCPPAILCLVRDPGKHMELILPFICRNYKQSPSRMTYLTLAGLNNSLPAPYVLASESQNYLTIAYLAKLITFFCRREHVVGSQYQKLEDVEQTLSKFNLSIMRESTQFSPLESIRLLCKYLHVFAKGDEPSEAQRKGVISMVLEVMIALKGYFEGEAKNGEKVCGNLLCNIETLGLVLVNSGLLQGSIKSKDLKERREKESAINGQMVETFREILDILSAIPKVNAFAFQQSLSNLLCSTYLNLYGEWQGQVKEGHEKVKINIYLCTVAVALKTKSVLNEKLQVLNSMEKKSKTCSLSRILDLISKEPQIDGELVQLSLITLADILGSGEIQQKQRKGLEIASVVISHADYFISLCMRKIGETPVQQANQIQNSVQYCLLLQIILEMKNASIKGRERNNDFGFRKKNQSPILKAMGSQGSDLSSAHKILQKIFNSLLKCHSTCQLQVLLCELGIKYDIQLIGALVELGYLTMVVNSIQEILQMSIKKEGEPNWLIRCLNLFNSLYIQDYVRIEPKIGTVLSQSLFHTLSLHLIKYSNLVSYIHMLLPLFSTDLRTNKQNQTLFQTTIIFLANDDGQELSQAEHYLKIIQIFMVYLNEQEVVINFIKNSDKLEALKRLIRLLMVLLEACGRIKSSGQGIGKWMRVLAVITLKISQFVHIFSSNDSSLNTMANSLAATISSNQKSILSISNSPSITNSMKQLLTSSKCLLEQKEEESPYSFYNEALVSISMENQKSLCNLFVGMAKNIIQNKNQEKFRGFYLFYFMVKKIINDGTGRYIKSLHQPYDESKGPEARLHLNVKQALIDLTDHLTQFQVNCTMIDLAWHTIILHRILKFHPQLFRIGKTCARVIQFCCKLSETLLNTNEEKIGLDDWLCYVEVLGILCLVFRTNCQSDQMGDESIAKFLRKAIYQKIRLWIVKWQKIRGEGLKLLSFPLEPVIGVQTKPMAIKGQNGSKQIERIRIRLQNETIQPQDKKEDSEDRKINQGSTWAYLKFNMLLYALYELLSLYRLDIYAHLLVDIGYKAKLIEFTRMVLHQFLTFHDICFKLSSQSDPNAVNPSIENLSKNLKNLVKSSEITNTQNYLNKILAESILISNESHHPFMRKQISRNQSLGLGASHSKDLAAILWYNGIQEILASMGEKVSYRFALGKGNGPLGSRRSSLGLSASKRMY